MKKIYKYWTVKSGTVCFAIITLLCIIMAILGGVYLIEGWLYSGIFGVSGLSILWIVSIARRIYMPIYYDDKKVMYRNKQLDWEEVRIVAYPCMTRSFQYAYLLVFSNEYLLGTELKQALKEGFYIQLTYEYLKTISPLYHHKIKIIDAGDKNSYIRELRSTKKINELFDSHNNKYQ